MADGSNGRTGKGTLIAWPYIEQTQGARDWRNLDSWVNQAQAHGVRFFVALELFPPWAVSDQSTCRSAWGYERCTGMPDLTAFDRFVTAMVTRYKGRMAMYELYNEPDIPQIGSNGFSGTVDQLVTLTQHGYDIIRSIDPSALIASPSGGSVYMDKYWAAGGVKTVDVLSFHLYTDPTRYTTSQYAAAERVQYWLDSNLAVFAKYGLTQPVWNTEGSWNTQTGVMANDDDQAAFVARSYLLSWSKGVTRSYWYAWDHDSIGTLWGPATGEHKAANAYRQVYNWMVGATMPSRCSTSGASVMFGGVEPAQYACPLTRPGGYQALAVWNTNGPTSYTPSTVYTRYRNLDGSAVTITTGPITIGYKPILLENKAALTP